MSNHVPSRCLAPLLLMTLALAATPNTEAADVVAETSWGETARDVYLDGVLQPAAWALVADAPERLAIVVPGLRQGWEINLETDQVAARAAADFAAFVDLSGATTMAWQPTARAAVTRVATTSGTLMQFSLAAHHVMIAPHMGAVGPVTMDALWHQRPSWRSRYDAHRIDPALVDALRAWDAPVTLTIAFGTWCGDSRRGIPGLLRTLDEAANPNILIDLVAIERGFTAPLDVIQREALTNVPTVIVHRGDGTTPADETLGRLVETPIGDSLEHDLVALLAGDLPRHPGTAERQTRVARGQYRFTSPAGDVVATEDWSLHTTTRDRHLLVSRLTQGPTEVEVFQRFATDGSTQWIEVTRRAPNHTARSRASSRDGSISITTRGSNTGIVRQNAMLPAGELLGPSVATAGRSWLRAERPTEPVSASGFRLTAAGAGHTVSHALEPMSARAWTTPAGPRPAQQVRLIETTADGESRQSTWWLDEALGVPIAGTTADGLTIELTALEIP